MASLRRELANYFESGRRSFHTPGHKGRADLLAPIQFPAHDLTELPELDMLHNPQGVIAEAQKNAAGIYGAEETFFLVNGATVGNQAMFLSLMKSCRGKKIRIDRRMHRSVIAGLILSGLEPEYVAPVIHPDFQLPLGLKSSQFCKDSQDIGAFHLTNPGYYGSVADLQAIVAYRDSFAPDIPILVDQAHGAHFRGELFPAGAVQQGADLVVHSTHKTLAALTQAAMLHVRGNRIDRQTLRDSLELLQSSSPSYLLMASLENAVSGLPGFSWQELYEEVMALHAELEGKLRILTAKDIGAYGIDGVDWTKILVNLSSLDISVQEFVKIIRDSYLLEPELWDDQNVLFIIGIGNRPQDIRLLKEALLMIAKQYGNSAGSERKRKNKQLLSQDFAGFTEADLLPPVRLTPREAWLAQKRTIKSKAALGCIAGETISIYPPGIPLLAAGEEITPYAMNFIHHADQYQWQGWQGYRQGEILVLDI